MDLFKKNGISGPSPNAGVAPTGINSNDLFAKQGISDQDISFADKKNIGDYAKLAGQEMAQPFIGLVHGSEDMIYGPIQAGLQRIDPTLAKKFTDYINKSNTLQKYEIPGGGLETGKVLGETAAIATGGEAASAIKALTTLPPLLLDALYGGASEALKFHKDPENANRLEDGLAGAAGGVAGGVVGRVGAATVGKLINSIGITRYVKTIIDSIKNHEPHLSQIKQHLLETYQQLKDIKNNKYELRNIIGEDIGPIEAAPIKAFIDDFKTELKKSPVSTRINNTVNEIQRILGTTKTGELEVGGTVLDPNNPLHAKLLDALKAQGVSPGGDTIEPNQLFAAITHVNKEIGQTKNAAKLNQLRRLKAGLTNEVKTISEQTGKSADQLLATHQAANKFYRENILPYHKVFGINEDGLAANLTTKQVDDKMVAAIDSNDPEKLRGLAKLVGQAGRPAIRDTFMREALNAGRREDGRFDSGKIYQYLDKRKVAQQELLSQSERNQINGFANMMNEATRLGKSHSHSQHWAPTVLTVIGLEHMGQGALMGDLHKIASGGAFVGSGILAYSMRNTFSKLVGSSGGRALLEAASKLPPESPKLQQLLMRAVPLITRQYGADKAAQAAHQLAPNLP